MEINDEVKARIESLIAELDDLDPAELPGPAAELATLLGEVLEGTDESE